MDDNKQRIIMELMKELADSMEFGKEDFESRLGRKKPDVEIMKIEGDIDADMMPIEQDESPMMEEESEDMDMMADGMQEEESPEEKLKNRLMKLRG